MLNMLKEHLLVILQNKRNENGTIHTHMYAYYFKASGQREIGKGIFITCIKYLPSRLFYPYQLDEEEEEV